MRKGAARGGTTYSWDALRRVTSIVRADGDATVGVSYSCDAAGRLSAVVHTDGVNVRSRTLRFYDAADRLIRMEHRGASNELWLQLDYVWNPDNTVARRLETELTATGVVTTEVSFSYDARQRLIGETRVIHGTPPQVVYALSYTYDALGNRRTKYEAVSDRLTEYVYDTDPAGLDGWQDPNQQIQTRNNRLLRYYEYAGGPGGYRLARTVWYTYYQTGHVSNITVKDEPPAGADPNDPRYAWYYDLALYYTLNQQLFRAIWDRWQLDPNTQTPTGYERLWRRDFQYDGPRQRVLTREYRPYGNGWDAGGLAERRTDYLGDEPYEDYMTRVQEVTEPPYGWTVETTPVRRYLSGFGVHAEQAVVAEAGGRGEGNAGAGGGRAGAVVGGQTLHLHGDLVRSTMLTTDEGGMPVMRVSYTAFGEPVAWAADPGDPNSGVWRVGFPAWWNDGSAGLGTRYQYAGGWGYESGVPVDWDALMDPNVPWDPNAFVPPDDLLGLAGANPALPPIQLLHVGWRWYDPSLGRFVQRDPIGLLGGASLYAYCAGQPTIAVDPQGLKEWVEYTSNFRTIVVGRKVVEVAKGLWFVYEIKQLQQLVVLKRDNSASITAAKVGAWIFGAAGATCSLGAGLGPPPAKPLCVKGAWACGILAGGCAAYAGMGYHEETVGAWWQNVGDAYVDTQSGPVAVYRDP